MRGRAVSGVAARVRLRAGPILRFGRGYRMLCASRTAPVLSPNGGIVGNSLQEQLLKAGLVSEQRLKDVRTDKHKAVKQTGKRGPQADDPARAAAERARAEKARKDLELNRQRQEEAQRRAHENEIRQLIHTHRVVREAGDLAYNFTDGNTLKRLHVTKDQHARLADGRLAVVRQDAFYELVPAEIAERLRARDAHLVLVHNQPAKQPDADDPYAEFKVPDDLIW
jgi:hypothetical protein